MNSRTYVNCEDPQKEMAEAPVEMGAFKKELEDLINSHSIENACDMPDFLMAEMITGIIKAIGETFKKTLDWHGCDSVCHPKKVEKTKAVLPVCPKCSSDHIATERRLNGYHICGCCSYKWRNKK